MTHDAEEANDGPAEPDTSGPQPSETDHVVDASEVGEPESPDNGIGENGLDESPDYSAATSPPAEPATTDPGNAAQEEPAADETQSNTDGPDAHGQRDFDGHAGNPVPTGDPPDAADSPLDPVADREAPIGPQPGPEAIPASRSIDEGSSTDTPVVTGSSARADEGDAPIHSPHAPTDHEATEAAEPVTETIGPQTGPDEPTNGEPADAPVISIGEPPPDESPVTGEHATGAFTLYRQPPPDAPSPAVRPDLTVVRAVDRPSATEPTFSGQEPVEDATEQAPPIGAPPTRLPGSIPRPVALLAAAASVALVVWAALIAGATVVKPEVFVLGDGWAAVNSGDWRLAASAFGRALDEDTTSTAPLDGLACASWSVGYQDSALWYHQLYLGTKSRPLPTENSCLGDLSIWNMGETTIEGELLIFPLAVEEAERGFEAIALDDATPKHIRLAAMTCLSHRRNLKLIGGIHLGGLLVTQELAARDGEVLEDPPPDVSACVDGLLSDYYATDDGAVAPDDFFSRLFVGNVSPLPPKGPLPLPIPAPVGPDGELIEGMDTVNGE